MEKIRKWQIFVQNKINARPKITKFIKNVISGSVVELTNANFESTISKHQLTFINFYMRWCGPCMERSLWNSWETVGTEMERQNQPVVIARVDCIKNKQVCDKYDIHRFPSFVAYVATEKIGEYAGDDRSLSTLLQYARNFKKTLQFSIDVRTFYDGPDLVPDFWIDSDTPEIDCRGRCIESDGCVGYTVKIEPPLLGQCYLKGGSIKQIQKIPAQKYNSGLLPAN